MSRIPLIYCRAERLVDLVAQQWTQLGLVALGKGRDDHLERGARPFEKLRRIKAGICVVDAGETRRHRIARRLRRGGRRRHAIRTLAESDHLVCWNLIPRRLGLPHHPGAAPLVAGAPAENAAQPQHEKGGDHREQDDIEIVREIAHIVRDPATIPDPSGGTLMSL